MQSLSVGRHEGVEGGAMTLGYKADAETAIREDLIAERIAIDSYRDMIASIG